MELHKKVIGNAVSAYFLVFVSLSFLISKKPYVNHPFVRNHVKSAFLLHILLLWMFFIMSYSFLDTIKIFSYSINTLITSFIALFLFWWMLYGAWKAHNGETVTIGEIFHSTGVKKDLFQHTNIQKLWEEDTLILILAHIPFLGYFSYGSHRDLPHIRDISILNMIISIISVLIFIFWYTSLASIIMLSYIIWSVFQSLRLIFQEQLITLDTSILPTIEEKYILQKSLCSYLWNTLRKNTFVKLKDIITKKKQARYEQELSDLEKIKKLTSSPLPSWIFYIPLINFIWIFFIRSRDIFHIRNGLIITLIFIAIVLLFDWNSPLLLLTLFPICYGIWYLPRKAYRMPYIYDIYTLFSNIFWFIIHIFHKTRTLQKMDTTSTVTMNETKKES